MNQSADMGVLAIMCICSVGIPVVFGFIGYNMGKTKTIGPWVGALVGAGGGIIGIIILAFLPETPIRRPRRRGAIRPRGRAGSKRAGDEPEILPDFELRFRCPHCDKSYSITDPAKAGSKARCQGCEKFFRIPEPPPA